MTKRHFAIVADALRGIPDVYVRQTAASALAGYFSNVNPHFKRRLFMRACGLDHSGSDRR